MAAASANRYATETSGSTLPSWKVMASQVDPQMIDATAKRKAGLFMAGC
jgi:hypothetical protein